MASFGYESYLSKFIEIVEAFEGLHLGMQCSPKIYSNHPNHFAFVHDVLACHYHKKRHISIYIYQNFIHLSQANPSRICNPWKMGDK